MKIVLNSLFLIPNKVGGTETYLRGFLSKLTLTQKKKLLLVTNQENHNTFPGIAKKKLNIPASIRPLRLLVEQLFLPFLLFRQKADVIISFGYITPLFTHCPRIVVIFDLNWHYHPEEFSIINRIILKTLITLSAKRADHIITSSNASKRRISKVLKIGKEKISVVYGGVDLNKFSSKKKNIKVNKKHKIDSPYIFTVSAA